MRSRSSSTAGDSCAVICGVVTQFFALISFWLRSVSFEGLTLRFRLKDLSLDHAAASVELSVFRGCSMCLCAPEEFANFASADRADVSVQHLGEMYMASLADLALHIRREKARGVQPTIAESEAKLAELVKTHSVHCFPALFAANSQAHLGLLRVVATKLNHRGPLGSLNTAARAAVESLFSQAIELDYQIKRTPLITAHACAGFELGSVNLLPPLLHSLKGVKLVRLRCC